MLGQQGLQVGLDPVLLQAGIDAEVVAGVVQDLGQRDQQRVAVAPAYLPHRGQRLTASPAAARSTATAARRAPTVTVHGGLIQFSGLYARSSAWIDTEPSALTRMSRVAIGRWAVSRPA